MKLLIVEDNLSVRRILKTITASFADEICECADGDEALTIYRAEKPDFVLMDINLSGEINGIEAARRIRAFDPKAKIIIVTSYDESDLRHAAAEAGTIGFIVKEDLSSLKTMLKIFWAKFPAFIIQPKSF